MRQKSFKISGHDEDDADDGEELYECIDTMQPTVGSTNGGDPEGTFREPGAESPINFAPSPPFNMTLSYCWT